MNAAEVGTRFAEAFARKDATGLREVLSPDVDFRAMTPGMFWEASTATEVVDDIVLGQWLEPADHVDALDALEVRPDVGDRHRVDYRIRVTNGDGVFAVEQVAYFEVAGEQISWLRIMCSGYRPIEPAPSSG